MFNKNKPQKLLNFLDKDASPKDCNDLELQSLLEAGERIKKASFNSTPASSGFQADLKARILEKRQITQTSMSEKFTNWLMSIVGSFKFKTAIASLVLVAVVLTTVRFWPESGQKFSKLFIDTAYAQDNFEIEPTQKDSLGVEGNTEFVIKSKQAIDKNELLKYISVFPEIKYDLKNISEHEFKLIPTEKLQPKTVYRVHIDSAYVDGQGIAINRDYSWAFQVKDTFKIFGTLPANKSAQVPLNSGIEINFSHENFIDYEKHFSISPKTEGRFEKHGRTLVFVPKKLQPATIYTVTIDKDIGLEGSNEKLQTPYTFKFETDSTNRNESSFRFVTNFTEFGTNNLPILPAYTTYNPSGAGIETKIQTGVYAYSSVDEFKKALDAADTIPSWALYTRYSYLAPATKLSKVISFEAGIQEYKNGQYIVFPQKLPAGYYLVEAKHGNDTQQSFVQITDLASYVNVTKNKTLLWVNDLQTGKPSANAVVTDLNSNLNVKTNDQGVAVLDSSSLIKSLDNDSNRTHYLKITQGNKSALLHVFDNNSYLYSDNSDNFWSYFYTDRQLYQSNDQVSFWGYIKRRNNEGGPKQVTVKLDSGSYGYYDDSISLDEKSFDVNDSNTFSGNLKLDHVAPGNYSLSIMVDGKVVQSRYITVEKYTKPAYQIEVTPDKRTFYAGNKVGFTIRASFFEGTPVPGVNLKYSFDDVNGQVTTDGEGKARVEVSTDYQDCDPSTYNRTYCNFPDSISLEVSPVQSEEGEITGSGWVKKFGPSIVVDTNLKQTSNNQAQLTIKTNKIITDLIEKNADQYAEYLGGPAAQISIIAHVKEISYVQHDDGEYYDFLEKKTYPRYTYERVEKPLLDITEKTGSDGVYSKNFNIDLDRSYEVKVEARDNNNRLATGGTYLYSDKNFNNSSDYEAYYLSLKNGEKNDYFFATNEEVKMELLKNGESLPKSSDSVLYYTLQQGLKNYHVQSDGKYQFKFSDQDVPSINVGAVYFDGTTYYSTPEESIRFDTKEKETKLQVTPDKNSYKPGEKVTLQIHAEDKNKKPLQTSLNLNLVDEAFYKLSYEVADPLGDIYHSVGGGSVYAYATHKYVSPGAGSAEGGGCFLDGTKITMADGSVKNIEDIKKGDHILTFKDEYSNQLVPGVVAETYHHKVAEYLVINDRLFVTPEHRIFVNHTWVPIGEAKVGDMLMDDTGKMIKIETIEKHHELVHVHNFQVEKYHTYIADGIYVHNDKGGDRAYFTDVALFTTTQTNSRGDATVTFQLPDNITSWRVTTQAISKDLHAGANTTQIPVSLPLFADSGVATEYLRSDEPIIKARAYGSSLKTGDKVNLTFEAATLGITKQNQTTEAFKSAYFNLPKLTVGEHQIKVGVDANNLKDVVVKKTNVIDSRVLERTHEYQTLKEGIKINAGTNGRTTLTFTDEGRAKVYYDLTGLTWNYSDRIDAKIAEKTSYSLLEKYFNQKVELPDNTDWTKYQTTEGGIALLPYSSADLELSAKISVAQSGKFDRAQLQKYFNDILEKKDANQEEIALAYLGLAGLNEPVLPALQRFASITDLSVKNKLVSALALQVLGDQEQSRKIYLDIMKKYGENLKPYIRINVGKNETTNLDLTMYAAILSSAVKAPEQQALWNYIENTQTNELLLSLEKSLYLSERLTQLSSDAASFNMIVDGKKQKYELKNGYSISVSLSPDQLASVSFDSIKGAVGVISLFEKPAEITSSNTSPLVSLKREYVVQNKVANTLNQEDLVEVRLYPSISSASVDGAYQVSDYLPSGLKVTSRESYKDVDANPCSTVLFPYQIDGQTVKFTIWKGESYFNGCSNYKGYFSYYARVVGPGSYAAEPAMIQSMKSDQIKNFSSPDRITIKQ